MPRELTKEEVQNNFLDLVWSYIDYADNEDRWSTARQKLEGLAFSLLVILDGGSGLPGFIVAPNPHPEDKQFHKDEGENWYPESPDNPNDIAGGLHESFHKRNPRAVR